MSTALTALTDGWRVRKAKLGAKKRAGYCYRCYARPKEIGGRCGPCAERQAAYNRMYWRKNSAQLMEKKRKQRESA